jgi:hypothetical protein
MLEGKIIMSFKDDKTVNLPVQNFSFDTIDVDIVSHVAKTFGFKFTTYGKKKFTLIKSGVHMGGYTGNLKECYAYLMGYQAKNG